MHERLLGYIFITIGILVMATSVYSVYMVFSNQIKPFNIFTNPLNNSREDKSSNTENLLMNPASIAQMQKEIVTEVLDKQINKSMNMAATLFFIYFIMLFGFRVASLGVQLIRPINVSLQSSHNTSLDNKPL